MAAYLRSRAMPLGGLKRLATRPPSVTTASLITRRAKASLAQDGQQQVGKAPIGHGRHHVLTGTRQLLSAHLETADPAVFDIIERVRLRRISPHSNCCAC